MEFEVQKISSPGMYVVRVYAAGIVSVTLGDIDRILRKKNDGFDKSKKKITFMNEL